MSQTVLDEIRGLLREASVKFREIHHEPTFTSEDSARIRGEELRVGGKALLLKTDNDFRLFVISAARRVDSGAIRRHLGLKKTRFATAEELRELTGLVPGAVPPFGRPILPFELYVDRSIVENERIAFNAGSVTDSMICSVEDYVRVADPSVFEFGR
jgi:prolyl-tRNA editing enzyme YbaK/EbsC (Cys-tRNA(Pro) deacylase)